MALVFPRVARNLAKNGFFPTDAETVRRIGFALTPTGDKPVRILDPCCGEGEAVDQLVRDLGLRKAKTYGVELDADRAIPARQRLTHLLWSDVQDTSIEAGAFDLLFLNPPYGDLVADKAATGNEDISRFEELFVRRTMPTLAMGGVMVLIIPHYEMRPKLCGWLARSFDRLTVRRAAVDTYKQVVIFGVRRRAVQGDVSRQVAKLVEMAANLESIPFLPESPDGWVDGVTEDVAPEQFIAVAADSIQQLRKADVARVLDEAPRAQRHRIASHIKLHRVDLSDEVDQVLSESGGLATETFPLRGTVASEAPIRFVAHELDPVFLGDAAARNPVLWNTFESCLGQGGVEPNKPPLHEMSDWHIAMLTASGQSNGVIADESGYQVLVKGQTTKTQHKTVEVEYGEDGLPVAEVSTVRERFVASIRALDITPWSPRFGESFTVQ